MKRRIPASAEYTGTARIVLYPAYFLMMSPSSPNPPVSSSEIDPVALIQRHQTGLWRYLRGLGCDNATADDLVQETFLKILQKPFDHFDDSSTAAYLRRIAHNQFVSNQRRAGKVIAVENIQQFERVWCELISDRDGDDYLEALRDCFHKLGDRSRWALEMRFRQRLSRSDIAGHLAITEHGAKNLMQRAKGKLRECVERSLGFARPMPAGELADPEDHEDDASFRQNPPRSQPRS